MGIEGIKILAEHNWPKDNSHKWGRWEPESKTVQYRVCIHPDCNAIERKVAPKTP